LPFGIPPELYEFLAPEDNPATTERIALGEKLHHDVRLAADNTVSCEMCHPNAANTDPETYPKYQVQLQRVALLRGMINWCIQHATKGQPLEDNDPTLRAMEAYITAQRKGEVLEPGKH
jgi:thiosulfate dehydrogenase